MLLQPLKITQNLHLSVFPTKITVNSSQHVATPNRPWAPSPKRRTASASLQQRLLCAEAQLLLNKVPETCSPTNSQAIRESFPP